MSTAVLELPDRLVQGDRSRTGQIETAGFRAHRNAHDAIGIAFEERSGKTPRFRPKEEDVPRRKIGLVEHSPTPGGQHPYASCGQTCTEFWVG